MRHLSSRAVGFTLLELLVVLAIIGLLAVVGLGALGPQLQQGRQDDFVQEMAQAITAARGRAMRSGVSHTVTFTSTGYAVTRAGDPAPVQAEQRAGLSITPQGYTLQCSSKGFCLAYQAGQLATLAALHVSPAPGWGGRSRTVTITLLGLTRVQ